MQAIAERSLVVEELGRPEFDRMRRDWDALVARSGRDEPFFRHRWLRIWLDNFAPEARLRLFVARRADRLIAALPLIDEPARMYGLAVRRLRAPANVHSNRFDLVCEPQRPDALRALWSHLRATGGFDVLVLPDVPAGAAARALWELAGADGAPVASWESMRSPRLSLAGGFEAVQARLGGHFRANLRRRRRKLEGRGRVEFERVVGGLGLEGRLEEALVLERAGWKGRDGTAVGCDPVTRGFYAELVREAALAGELSLGLLRLDGRPVAFHLGLESGGTYYLPKTGYDEAHADCSPGQLLTEQVLRDAAARGLKAFDFLGPAMDWKRAWADGERVHHWLYVFGRGRRGRLLRELKARWVPAAREVLSWRR